MAQMTVQIGSYSYKLACRDGEEQRLEELAQYVDSKAKELTKALGQVSESRMLLMAALMVTDELFEARDKATFSASGDILPLTNAMADLLAAASARTEAITAKLEGIARSS